MLLAFAIVLFTIAVYMGLDAVTVRQKQVATSLARARRYGGADRRASPSSRRTSPIDCSHPRRRRWPTSHSRCR